MGTQKKQPNSSAAFKAGAISLAFLILGYQAALFVHRAATLRIEANRDRPDTVYIYLKDRSPVASTSPADRNAAPEESSSSSGGASSFAIAPSDEGASATENEPFSEYHYSTHSAGVERVRKGTRKVESFRFNPNTAGLEELQRLGFSEKQAQSILNYRSKGGRFRRKEDFAKSFVVADSVYRRLEPYIDIPLLDINTADSAAFDALPGIGPWFATKMVEYRDKIGGYTSTEQLMDIDRFDSERYEGLKDLVTCGSLNGGGGSE